MKRKPYSSWREEPDAQGVIEHQAFCLVVPSQTRYLNLVTGLAKRAAMVVGLDDATAAKVSIAVDEAVTNVIMHAYHGEPEHSIDIDLEFTGTALEVHIWHTGKGLKEDEIVLPDPREYVKHPRKSGLGLLLMSRFMDEVHFGDQDGRSQCCMIKRVS